MDNKSFLDQSTSKDEGLPGPYSINKCPDDAQIAGEDVAPSVQPYEAVHASPRQWPFAIKAFVLALILFHSLMASWCAAAFIPAFRTMAAEFGQEIDHISYLVGAYTLLLGFGVLLWNPLSEVLGRRPVTILATVIALGSTCGCACAHSYKALVAARIFQGLGMAVITSLGPAYIKEMFSTRWRGITVGLWTLSLTIGPFVGPLVSGFIARSYGWRWILWSEAIILASLLLAHVLLLPESIPETACYRPPLNVNGQWHLRSLVIQLPRPRHPPNASDRISRTVRNTLACAQSPIVWLTGLAFSVQYGYVAVSMSSLFPVVYGRMYGFNEAQQGLLYLPMLIGSLLAELFTGSLGDWVVSSPRIARMGRGGSARLEYRLLVAVPGAVLAVAGMMWFGISVQRHRHWIIPALGTACAALGVQSVISICFSYAISCHEDKAKEVATVMNLFRVLSSFVVLFYNQPLLERVGYAWGFAIQSFVTFAFDCGLLVLLLFGRKWR